MNLEKREAASGSPASLLSLLLLLPQSRMCMRMKWTSLGIKVSVYFETKDCLNGLCMSIQGMVAGT